MTSPDEIACPTLIDGGSIRSNKISGKDLHCGVIYNEGYGGGAGGGDQVGHAGDPLPYFGTMYVETEAPGGVMTFTSNDL